MTPRATLFVSAPGCLGDTRSVRRDTPRCQASIRMVTLTEVSSERQVSRFTASNLEKHDWQAPMLSDPYFLHSDSRVDSQSFDTPDRGQDASGRLTTGRPHARSTQRQFTCFRELQKQVTKAERTERRRLCDAQAHRDLVAKVSEDTADP